MKALHMHRVPGGRGRYQVVLGRGNGGRCSRLLPGVRWPGFAPRSLEVLYGIAADQREYWEGAWLAAQLFDTGATRAARGQAWRWERVLQDLHRVLAARVPRQEAPA